ncbi:MAG: hypothetical protein EXQ56_14245 [Acidobacteria bacterium]|nr:hypothetical protein [Acidobacteriota bacterium]
MATNIATTGLIGRRMDDLSLPERLQYANQWIAFKKYIPPKKTSEGGVEFPDVKIRRVEAAGASAQACITQLKGRHLDPAEFEFTIMKPPY